MPKIIPERNVNSCLECGDWYHSHEQEHNCNRTNKLIHNIDKINNDCPLEDAREAKSVSFKPNKNDCTGCPIWDDSKDVTKLTCLKCNYHSIPLPEPDCDFCETFASTAKAKIVQEIFSHATMAEYDTEIGRLNLGFSRSYLESIGMWPFKLGCTK